MVLRIFRHVLPVLFVVTAVGCANQYATPEATFQTFRTAVSKKRWDVALEAMSPQAQDRVVGGLLVLIAGGSIGNSDAAALAEKYGIAWHKLAGRVMAGALGSKDRVAGAVEGLDQFIGSISDKVAFVADAQAWAEKMGLADSTLLVNLARAELLEARIDGNVAHGDLSRDVPFHGDRIRFVRVGSRWLIDL